MALSFNRITYFTFSYILLSYNNKLEQKDKWKDNEKKKTRERINDL